MNEIINSLFNRKSVRAFEQKAVPEEQKQLLLECAAQAPTAGNQQLYTIIDITDQTLKEHLAVLCDDQPFIAKAPLVLVFLADGLRWLQSYNEAGCKPRGIGVGDLMLAFSDANIAAQNMVVAAESLGLGSCYIGDILERKEELQKLLELPQQCMPACMLVLGYPTLEQQQRKKLARFDREYFVYENRYHNHTAEALRRFYTDRAKRNGNTVIKPFDDYMKSFCSFKYNSDFSREMTRSVSEYLKEFENAD